MAVSNAGVSFAAMVLLAGSIVCIFFVILAGVSPTTPLDKTFFLSADTSGITGARARTQWTFFYDCSPGNVDCSGPWPAPGFGWAWSANPANAPAELTGSLGGDTTNSYYFYMWRFGWVLYIIGLFFEIMALFSGFLACCGRLGSAIAGLVSVAALFFYTIAVALMTTVFVKARNAFLASNRDAFIGTYAFGFSWGAWGALLLATILFCLGTRGGERGFSRRRSVRSRRSYDMGSRRVKEDYA